MSKLVEQLRSVDHGSVRDCFMQSPLFEKAADAITDLEAENAGLRESREFWKRVSYGWSQRVEAYKARLVEALKALDEIAADDEPADVDGMSGPHNLATALANLAAAHNVETGKWVKFSTTYKVLSDGSIQVEGLQLIEVREEGKVK